MAPSSEAPRDLADRVIRQALQHPANLRAFVPALAGGFDCERGRLLEREFPLGAKAGVRIGFLAEHLMASALRCQPELLADRRWDGVQD